MIFTHPIGNQNARHAAVAMAEGGLLEEFWTSIDWHRDSLFDRLAPARLRQQLRRRSFPPELEPYLRTYPWREIGRQAAQALKLHSLTHKNTGAFSIDAVCRSVDGFVAERVLPRHRPDSVYAYEDAADQTFRAGRQLGWHCFYELPIGYWRAARAIFHEECERQPEWAPTLGGISDPAEKLERKDRELQNAHTVIVPSDFVRETLQLAPDITAPIIVHPYGAPSSVRDSLPPETSGPLKILFVGSLGQRKGLAYILEALRMLKSGFTFTLIGRKEFDTCAPLNDAVSKYRWVPTLPHAEVLAEMGRHDVLVFPSLFEGFGLVILEALSQGIPVITTPNSGGYDLITHGEDGFRVPIRSAEAIAESLDKLASDRTLLSAMKAGALKTAARRSWENYRRGLLEIVRGRLK